MDSGTDESSLPALISIKHNPKVPEITRIHSDKLIVGRGVEATLKILETVISRKHCTLEKIPSFGWMITSHSRNAVEINSTFLPIDQSKSIKCGDKISFAGICLFVFKCAPDQNRMCCCDRKQGNQELVDTTSNEINDRNDLASNSSILSCSSSSDSSKVMTTATQRNVPIINTPTSSTSTEVADKTDLTSSSEFRDVVEEARKYTNETNDLDKKTKDRLKETLNHLEQLQEVNEKFSDSMTDSAKNALLPTVRNLLSFCKANYKAVESCDSYTFPDSSDVNLKTLSSRINTLLRMHMRRFMFNITEYFELASCSTSPSSPNNGEVNSVKEAVPETIPKTDVVNKSEDNDGKLKDELKNYKQNSEWQDARIKYLEMKLKERDKMEKALESAREETENLETQLREMRTKLSKMEILELELSYFKESSKYKEDDKRNKDELEKQIETLKGRLKEVKDEIDKISATKSVLESENMSLKQKCQEIEKKLNTKVGCSSNATTGEYCCDLFSSLKENVLEALEKEFTCCICNEMFVGATVTNCNHVFCAFCLKEWKKKKKQCPFCRAALTSEHRANVIDECITNLVKFISDKLYAERIQMIEDRKSVGAPPPAKKARRGRSTVQQAQIPVPVPPIHLMNQMNQALNGPIVHPNFVIDLRTL